MKPSILSVFSLVLSTTAAPSDAGFSLVGFAKDHPPGTTTGGAGKNSKTVTVTTVAEFKKVVTDNEPTIIYANDTFNLTSRVQIGSNKSLIGLGKGAQIIGAGLNIYSQTNVIIRNFGLTAIPDDAITIRNSTRVWIDHNEFTTGNFTANGPDLYDGQLDIIRANDWITVSWNYFHDHWKSSLHHNYWRNMGTRGPAGRFGHQHIYNNLYEDFLYQAIHSRSDNQVLVEANVFKGKTREALSTYGLVIPDDSPNTSLDGDFEIDGYANLGAANNFGTAGVNITQGGDFATAPYVYTLTTLGEVKIVVKKGVGLGKIHEQ
ncbi:pectin lyase-like protein [Clathrospora elynae]|uniref:Pectin lyase-like protein n=1 Tax=Clathrospora elynae TaxID=706981 RepID=A0A6A5SCU5_9PLEO|nr:pectin lyase-like protein [Clathrospora elynae]